MLMARWSNSMVAARVSLFAEAGGNHAVPCDTEDF
jgi:hypothetical protein